MKPIRKNRPGARWGFMIVHRISDRSGGVYLWRLRIVQTPWFGVLLHRISGPDPDPLLHDHPWAFLSIRLLGGYWEATDHRHPQMLERKHWWSFKNAEDLHAIRRLNRNPTWTLLFVGPRRRTWGFQTPEGWVPWNEYIADLGGREVIYPQ